MNGHLFGAAVLVLFVFALFKLVFSSLDRLSKCLQVPFVLRTAAIPAASLALFLVSVPLMLLFGTLLLRGGTILFNDPEIQIHEFPHPPPRIEPIHSSGPLEVK